MSAAASRNGLASRSLSPMPAASTTRPTRLCFAAAHVVMRDDYAGLGHDVDTPAAPASIRSHVDWGATMRLRSFLDRNGFGIAEAMDTAQRFFLGWDSAHELIERTAALSLRHGFCAGAGTDHLAETRTLGELAEGVAWQCTEIQRLSGIPVVLPMPMLCQLGCGEDHYVAVYRDILDRVDGPVFLHWLGPMFLPALQGYFPGDSLRRILALDRQKVRGIKISMLDDALEVRLRRELLPHDQIVLTGDDFHFGRMILGGEPGATRPLAPPPVQRWTKIAGRDVALGDFSHALLGVFDAIAEPAGRALAALTAGDAAKFLDLMDPCETLGRHVFCAPTQRYKAGLAFLAYAAGRQQNAMLVRREDRTRDAAHYRRCAELAVLCGALRDDEETAARVESWLAKEST